MTNQPHGQLPNMFPTLRYEDAAAAIEWLHKAFGFEQHMVVPGPDGTIAHAQLRYGPGMIMLGTSRDDEFGLKSPRDLGGVTQGVYITVDDVDAHYARAQEAGAEIVRDLSETDYGSREYAARDLEGNLWFFGTYRPNADK